MGEVLNAEPIAIMVRKGRPRLQARSGRDIHKLLLASGRMQVLWKKWFRRRFRRAALWMDMAPPESLPAAPVGAPSDAMEVFRAHGPRFLPDLSRTGRDL